MQTVLVSVVVPIFREGERLKNVFITLTKQSFALSQIEVLIVSPEDNALERAICEEYSPMLAARYLIVPSLGRAQGLNFGIRHARGEFICRIDGRSTVPDDYIERMYRIAVAERADVVGGVQRALLLGRDAWQDAIAICMNSPCGAGPSPHRTARRSGPSDNVYLGLYRRATFDRVGWFDEESPVISEEVDFYYRVRRAGGLVWLDAGLLIGYAPRSRLSQQLRLYYRYGGAKIAIALKHRTLITLRQLVAPGFYFLVASGSIFSPFSPLIAVTTSLLLLVYGMAVGLCSYREATLAGRKDLLVKVAATMISMHAGYAAGYFRKLLVRDKPGTYWAG